MKNCTQTRYQPCNLCPLPTTTHRHPIGTRVVSVFKAFLRGPSFGSQDSAFSKGESPVPSSSSIFLGATSPTSFDADAAGDHGCKFIMYWLQNRLFFPFYLFVSKSLFFRFTQYAHISILRPQGTPQPPPPPHTASLTFPRTLILVARRRRQTENREGDTATVSPVRVEACLWAPAPAPAALFHRHSRPEGYANTTLGNSSNRGGFP